MLQLQRIYYRNENILRVLLQEEKDVGTMNWCKSIDCSITSKMLIVIGVFASLKNATAQCKTNNAKN